MGLTFTEGRTPSRQRRNEVFALIQNTLPSFVAKASKCRSQYIGKWFFVLGYKRSFCVYKQELHVSYCSRRIIRTIRKESYMFEKYIGVGFRNYKFLFQ
jgi:hypothetical protein